MKPDPHSAEFITLIDRWLDQTASAEEAARLWQAVAECPDCAAALAAAARFESLLGATVQERASEKRLTAPVALPTQEKAQRQPQRPLRQGTAQSGVWGASTRQWVAAVAALIVVSLVSVFFWNEAGMERPAVVVHELVGPIQQPPLRLPKAPSRSTQDLTSKAGDLTEVVSTEPKELLTDHLDRFFLTGVSLDKVPLGRAIGILQGQLHEVNRDAALALDQLKVLVPTLASQRRITFHSGPIPFLKAVRAVAALAGCEVEVSEPQITITIQQSIYPEMVKKRVLSDMLAGRLNATGSPSITDPERLAALREDAESLGVKPAVNGSVAITRGQWEALKMLTETRDLLGRLPIPSYAIYAVPKTDPQPETTRVLTPKEEATARKKIVESKLEPLIIFTPQLASPTNRAPIQFQPYGDTVSLTLNPAYDPEADRRARMGPQVLPDPVIVSTRTIESNPEKVLGLGGSNTGAGLRINPDSISNNGNGTFSGANTTITGASSVQSGGTSALIGSNLQISGAGISSANGRVTTVTVAGNMSAETMTSAAALAARTGATLIIVPATNPPPPPPDP
jgi:hypothetical protein